jgi:3-oxoacyl-[acyl-carrier-protein] synthase-3
MTNVAILGLATWLPERTRENDEWPASFRERGHTLGDRTFNDIPPSEDPLSASIVARDLLLEATDPFLGVTRRHVAEESMTAVEAEVIAARAALADAGVSGADVDLVLSNAIVPDEVAAPMAPAVAHAVGAKRALALDVEAACATALAELDIASAYLRSGMANLVLITQSHLLLRAMPFLHPATPGLGDGAAAMVVGRGKGLSLRATVAVSHGEFQRAVTWVREHDKSEPPWWKSGGSFRLGSRATEQAKFLMRETVSYGAATVREVADRAGVDVKRIGVLASVQPRGFVPGAIAERLGLARPCAVTTYADTGHLGGCGPLFNLERARSLGLLTPSTVAVLYAQGAGFTRAAALVEVE